MDTYSPYTPLYKPDPAWEDYTTHKGYRVYGPSGRIFRYSVTFNGSLIDVAYTMRGARRLIRKHKARGSKPRRPRFWERPVAYEET